MDYFVNEGNRIGGQEPQALGTAQARITATVAVTKGMVVESTGDWTVGPAADASVAVVGIAANSAAIGERVVIETEGFVKLTATNAAIVAGNTVSAGGAGLIKVWAVAGDIVGKVIKGCAANGVAYVKLRG